MEVNHCLMALPGTKKADLKRVMSHPQALSQVRALGAWVRAFGLVAHVQTTRENDSHSQECQGKRSPVQRPGGSYIQLFPTPTHPPTHRWRTTCGGCRGW